MAISKTMFKQEWNNPQNPVTLHLTPSPKNILVTFKNMCSNIDKLLC